MATEWYIGLMSGTSLDGVDGLLCRFESDGRWGGAAAHVNRPFDASLRDALFALQASGSNELHRAALAANAVAGAYASACADLLQQAELPAAAVRAIGAHGQTVRHQPDLPGGGYTLQLNQPALLAELTGIDVIADFRSRDVAAGGQGAPLVPPFHAAVFGQSQGERAVVNIGGISNLTVLRGPEAVLGFDCGPGNALLDHWCIQHTGQPFDAQGAWGAGGQVHPPLLAALLSEPYFSALPPKSTGRDLFHAEWLAAHLAQAGSGVSPRDVQATLCELTATVVAHALRQQAPGATDLLVCGGGALNDDLMARLVRLAGRVKVRSTAEAGLPPLQVEAAAFAWLARQHCHREPGNLAAVTGARGPRVLGACYPA